MSDLAERKQKETFKMSRRSSMKNRDAIKLVKAKEHLSNLITRTEKTLTEKQTQQASILEQVSRLEAEVKDHFWKAIEYLLSEDRRLLSELSDVKDAQLSKLSQDLDAQHKTLQLYQGQLKVIQQVLDSSNEDEAPDVDDLCRSAYRKQARSEFRPLEHIRFERDEEELLKVVKQVPHRIRACSLEDPDRPAPVLSHVIRADNSEDKDRPDIRNITVNKVIKGITVTTLTDWSNRCIKSFYKKGKKHKEDLVYTGGSPFGIASVDQYVFVTDPALKKIFQLEVYPYLQIIATISTEKMYCGIAALGDSSLVVSGYEWSKSWASYWTVDIMDTNGNIERSIRDRVLQSPEYICALKTGSIVAADKDSRSLVYLSPEGDEYVTITPGGSSVYRLPQGVAVARTGEVLLVDTASNKVIEMTDTGAYIRDILTSEDGIERPRGICTDQDGHIYVTCGESVRVYKYK